MTIGLADISGQCAAHGRITAIYMMDVDNAVLPDHWLSGYIDGDITGTTALRITPTQGSAECTVREDVSDPGRAYKSMLTLKLSKGQQAVDELRARFLHAQQMHVIFTDSAQITRILEYARGSADFNISQRLGDGQQYIFTFSSQDATPPRIYAGALPI